ncbi:MAG: Sir2 family NAD-dependent protein deacetylase [Candidatus Eremiobacteraeota bacterium]|nr:Sir2 family NAD-dependent protein deacetylase [Candidatus Eremiobacteraeota bacterium]
MHELLERAGKVLVFTGAGISTGSGIADFRGPQGVWKRRQPVLIQEFLASHDKRVEYWDYKLEGYESFCLARPNAAHLALVELDRRGKLLAVVTQNIDGLHVLAGLAEEKVLELHGTNRLVACLDCDHREQPERPFREFEASRQPPKCPACGGWLKPATISFGQALDQALLGRAFALAEEADLVLSLGSTLSVEPAASVPRMAAQRGLPYVVVNRGATDHDHLASHRVEADLVEWLPQFLG